MSGTPALERTRAAAYFRLGVIRPGEFLPVSASSGTRREKQSPQAARLLSWKALGDNMIRTQISLDKKEYESAKQQAAALGISLAEFIRRAVRERLPVQGDGPWMKYAGFVESGNPRSSQSIDEIVYGSKD